VKTVWIVDGAYLFNCPLGKLDYLKLKDRIELELGEEVFESYYLNSTPDPPNDRQDSFHTWLRSAPPRGPQMRTQLYGLKTVNLKCYQCRQPIDWTCPDCGTEVTQIKVQKGVDVGIATLVLKLALQDQYERLILCAGDGDFEDAIAYVKSECHKEIWICGFEDTVSTDLQCYADRVVWLNDWWSDIERTS